MPGRTSRSPANAVGRGSYEERRGFRDVLWRAVPAGEAGVSTA